MAESLAPAKEAYEYIDCSNQAAGILLTGCSRLTIDAGLKNVSMGDVFDYGIKKSDDDKFFAVESKILPLSVPKNNYDETDYWNRGTYRYVKIKKHTKILPQNRYGDVIAVLFDADKMKPEDSASRINDFYLLQNTKMTFLYSKSDGVLAIGMVDCGDSGSIYWCESERCLFADREK